jgi:transposase
MPRPRKYPEELIDRGVRLALESGRSVAHVAQDIGLPSETLRKAVRRAEADQGLRPDLSTSEEREEIKRLERENFELRRANEILKAASVFSRPSSTQTVQSEPLHRGASRSLRRRADLPDSGRVGAVARHAGTAPVPASSGNTQRHRLHRGGDRQLNRAIHIIALSRARTDRETRAYLACPASGQSTRAEVGRRRRVIADA